MKVFVAITSYGTKNLPYLERVLEELRRMKFTTHITVLSEAPKDLGPDIEVAVRRPGRNPRTLPFAHKWIFAERLEQYDVFVYLEDDTLFRERNLRAFLEVTPHLPPDTIAGFLRYEIDRQGRKYCSSVHSHYFWDLNSPATYGGETFARFTNEHAACYVLTREQLRRAIASGGYLVRPHWGAYEILESAATDPYTQCGFTKVICLSRLDDFLLHHLPNCYIGKLGLPLEEVKAQIEALLRLDPSKRPYRQLFPTQKRMLAPRSSKHYYEKPLKEALSLVPSEARTVLSVGCGWGATEELLVREGKEVWGIPLDPVIAVSAERRGVRTLPADFSEAAEALGERRFDCIAFFNVLQHIQDPVAVLRLLRRFLSDKGVVVGSVPNTRRLLMKRRIGAGPRRFRNYTATKLHFTTRGMLRRWLKQSGFVQTRITGHVEKRHRPLHLLRWLFLQDLVASSLLFQACTKESSCREILRRSTCSAYR